MQSFWPVFLGLEWFLLKNRFVSAFMTVGALLSMLVYVGFFMVCFFVLFTGLFFVLVEVSGKNSMGWYIVFFFLSLFLIGFASELLGKIRDTLRFKRLITKSTGDPVSSRTVYDWVPNQGGSSSWEFIKGIVLFNNGVEFECWSRWAFMGIQRFCKKTYPSFQEVRAGE